MSGLEKVLDRLVPEEFGSFSNLVLPRRIDSGFAKFDHQVKSGQKYMVLNFPQVFETLKKISPFL